MMKHYKNCEIDIGAEIELKKLLNQLIETHQLEGLEHEIINRSRPEKVSYHIRFAGRSTSKALYNTQRKFNGPKNMNIRLYTNIDSAPVSGQLRITTNDEKFLFNP